MQMSNVGFLEKAICEFKDSYKNAGLAKEMIFGNEKKKVMGGIVKKFLTISVLLICILTTSCTMFYHSDIKNKSKTWIKYFKEEDAEGLMELFCSDIRDNYYDETLEEIETAFEFIDGNIISYEFKSEYGSRQTKDNFKTKLYYCYQVYFIETSTEKKYTIRFCYNYIWKSNPEREGVESIRVLSYEGDDFDGDGEEVFVGKSYEVNE